MIKATSLATFAALALTSVQAGAFEAIGFKDVPALVGKQVFAGTTQDARGTWIYAGEPLTLVSAEAYQKSANVTTYNFVRIKTKEGKEGEVQIQYLSKAPLRFNLRTPGKAKALVLAILNDAFDLHAKLHAFRSRLRYDIASSTQPDEYHQVESMKSVFEKERSLLYSLVYGASTSEEDILRKEGTRWIADAADTTLLDWYAHGIRDKAVRKKFESAHKAVGYLDNVSRLSVDLANLENEKTKKPWRERMTGVPADKLAKLDADNMARITSETSRKKSAIKDAAAAATKLKAQAQ